MTNEELALAIRQGRTEYITQLWENTEKLFSLLCSRWWSAYSERFTQCGITPDDLIQECYFVLIDAIAAYDSGSGFKFVSYFRYPMQKRFNTLLGYRGEKQPLNDCDSLNSLVKNTDDTDKTELLNTISDPDSGQDYELIENADYVSRLHTDLENAMKRKLNDWQINVVCDYYYSGLPSEIIGEKYDITRSRIRDILHKSYSKLSNDIELRQKYKDEILQDTLFKGTGLRAFKNTGMSSVERSIEIIERFLDEHKTDKTMTHIAEKRQSEI